MVRRLSLAVLVLAILAGAAMWDEPIKWFAFGLALLALGAGLRCGGGGGRGGGGPG